MEKWHFIKDKKPIDGQEVWYFFPIFNKVYNGFYTQVDLADAFGLEKPLLCDQFYGDHGFLTDEEVYWCDREKGDKKPEKPFDAKNKVEYSVEKG